MLYIRRWGGLFATVLDTADNATLKIKTSGGQKISSSALAKAFNLSDNEVERFTTGSINDKNTFETKSRQLLTFKQVYTNKSLSKDDKNNSENDIIQEFNKDIYGLVNPGDVFHTGKSCAIIYNITNNEKIHTMQFNRNIELHKNKMSDGGTYSYDIKKEYIFNIYRPFYKNNLKESAEFNVLIKYIYDKAKDYYNNEVIECSDNE